MYRLRMFQGDSTEDRIGVAVGFATINVIAPSVAVNHPKIVVWARAEQNQKQATTVEAVVNYWWRHYDVKPEFRAAVKDFLVYGHGWIKVGWRYREAERELEPEEQTATLEELAGEADEYAAQNPELAGDLPTNDDIAELLPKTEPVVIEDRPFVERVSPLDVLVDPEARNESELQWIAQRVVRPLEEAKVDPRYKSSARKKLGSDGSVRWQNEESTHHVKEDVERVTLWEFYDLQREQMSVFTEQGDTFLVDPVPLPYTYGHPFVMIRNYEVPDQFYPIGELEAIEPLQNELNDTRTGMVRARKGDIRKHLYRPSAFGPKGVEALRSDVDNTMIPVDADNTPFEDIVAAIPRNEAINPAHYQHSTQVEDDINLVTGVNEYMRGALPEVRRTATEASIVQDAANARAADKLDVIETSIANVARRLVQLAQAYLTGPQVARLTDQPVQPPVNPLAQPQLGAQGPQDPMNPAGATTAAPPDPLAPAPPIAPPAPGAPMAQGDSGWVAYEREDIQGEFDFSTEAGSTQPQNETFRRQQAMQLAQAVAPFVGTVIDPAMLAQHILREGFGIKNPEKFMLPFNPMLMGGPGAPGEAPPEGEGEEGASSGANSGANEDTQGGTDAVAPAQLAQLMGQVGFNPQTLGAQPNGGAALGPGAA